MDAENSDEFCDRLEILAEIFDVKLSPQRQALYFEALRDLSFLQVVRALNLAAKTCKFFPKPAELRTLVIGDTEDRAEQAWMLFRKAMKRVGSYSSLVVEDAALADTIVAMFGSWPQACASEFSDEMWTAKRKEFGRVYRVCQGRQVKGGRYLMGITEQQNAGKLDWMKFVDVKRLDGDQVQPLSLEEAEIARTELAAQRHQLSRFDAAALVKQLEPMARDETA